LILDAFISEQRLGRLEQTLVRRIFGQQFGDFRFEVEETTSVDDAIDRSANVVVVVAEGTRNFDQMAARQQSLHHLLAQGDGVLALIAARQLTRMSAVQNGPALQFTDDPANGKMLWQFNLF
jgi:hypothetical protein